MADDAAPEGEIDFGNYDLDGLRADVRSVVDIGAAFRSVMKAAMLTALVVTVVTWIVFSGRIESGAITAFFAIAAGLLALPLGGAIGAWRTARRRLDTVTEATGKVVGVVGEMHRDVLAVKEGHAETSVQQVAVGLLEEGIFPAVFGSVETAAEGAMGPMSFLSSKITGGPLALVQKSVIGAVESLPDRKIGSVADAATDKLQIDAIAAGLADDYAKVDERLTGVVAKAARTSLIVGLWLAFWAIAPLALWLVIGWVAS